MKKKYKVNYTWHSGECFGGRMYYEDIVEIEESDLDSWKHDFESENMDGSRNSIKSIKEIK